MRDSAIPNPFTPWKRIETRAEAQSPSALRGSRRSSERLHSAMAGPTSSAAPPPNPVRAARSPWSITTPPTQAPSALPRLKAAMFKLDARFWPAPEAFSSTRSCMGATVANAATPSSRRTTTTVDRRADGAAHRGRAPAPASPAMPRTACMGARSASLPPSRLPAARPPPNRSSIGRHRRFGEPGHLGEQRLDVREHGEHAGEAEHRHGQAEQHLRSRQHGDLLAERRRWGRRRGPRHERRQHHDGQHADRCHHPERGAPAEVQAEPRARRYPQQRRRGEPGEHDGDGRRAAGRRHQAGRHHRADAEERAVRERGEDPRGHQERRSSSRARRRRCRG